MISSASCSRSPLKLSSTSLPRWPPVGVIEAKCGETAVAVLPVRKRASEMRTVLTQRPSKAENPNDEKPMGSVRFSDFVIRDSFIVLLLRGLLQQPSRHLTRIAAHRWDQ